MMISGGKLRKIVVLSIWDEMWSLGEGCGVPDEMHFIERLTSSGVEIDYLIPEPAGGKAPYSRPGLKYHTYPNIFRSYGHLPGLVKRFLIPGIFPRTVAGPLEKLVVEGGADLVIAYSYLSLGPALKVARAAGIPSIAKLFGVMYLNHHHLPKIKYWWFNYEQILALRNRLDHYIVLNDGTQGAKALERRGIPAENITFLPNGMDMSWSSLEIDRDSARDSFGLPGGKTLLMTFSRLVRSKRVDLFLEAAAGINPLLMKDAAIVIGGDGPRRADLEAQARELGIADKVYFTGAVRYDEIPALLKACDIFVGTNELTNMSMPPCEAMLCGLPVVAFDVAGTSEAVHDGETGILVENDNIPALTAAMEKLLADPDMITRLGRGASRYATESFMSWEERTSKELGLLESIVTGWKRPDQRS